ncbi:MAG: MASE3 domain-containing protein [Syntrophobacteraceae bacterium]
MFRSGILPDKHTLLLGLSILAGLLWIGLRDYLLFHSLIEIFTVIIGWGIFVVAWNARALVQNGYLLFLGVAYLFVGFVDLVHMLSYKGMGVFPAYDANLPTQLWIITRYLESLSLLIAPFFIGRKIRAGFLFAVYTAIAALALLAVFEWRIFPDAFIEGVGLTPFKKASEYAICLILLGSLFTLSIKRSEFNPRIYLLLVSSVAITILSELAFTLYVDVYGAANMIGHFLRLLSSYLIYRAFIKSGISAPFDLIFHNLARSEKNLFSLLEGLPAFVFVQMPDHTIQFANRNFRDHFGEPDGKKCYQVFLGRDRPCEPCPTLEVLKTGHPQQRDWSVVAGKTHEMHEYPYRDIDDAPAVLKLGIDITDRKRMETELIKARNELEDRVKKRTAELVEVNEALRGEVAERKRMQEILQESEEELRGLSAKLLEAQESERQRIAMELHDSLGGSLSAVKFRIENAICRLEEPQSASPRQLFGEVVPLIQSLIEDVRRMHTDIYPSILADLGLIMALNWHFRKFQENYPQIRVEKALVIDETEVPDSLKIVIYRIVQEALNNIAKHSGADLAMVGLARDHGSLELMVLDNGNGFTMADAHASGRKNIGVGLSSMRERAKLSGGSLSFLSGEKGTEIRASWPDESER